MKQSFIIVTIALLLLSISLFADNRLVIYHNNFGMVTESVNVSVDSGLSTFTYDDLPSTIDANTVLLNPIREGSFTVQSQSYMSKMENWFTLLQQYLGKKIDIVMKDGSLLTGTLFYNDQSMVGIVNEKVNKNYIVRVDEIRNYVLEGKSDGLTQKPFLKWSLRAERRGEYSAGLTYMCSNMSWDGLYKAVWNDDVLHLQILANITNNTGRDYEDFRVSLIAGEPKRISPQLHYRRADTMVRGAGYAEMAMDSAAPEFTVEAYDEFHLFNYSEKVQLKDKESKQIRLYTEKKIRPNVVYEYQTGTNYVTTNLKITNDEKSSLGFILPKGKIQIYREENNDLTFVGEDAVKQVPVNEEWVVSPGRAFDIVGETTTIETRRPARNITERDMKVELRNRSNKSRNIEVIHRLSGNWTISRNNHQYERKDASTIVFKKELKPNEPYEIRWTERIEY